MKKSARSALSSKQRQLILLLGLPSVGLSSCLTVLSTYLPVLARQFTSSNGVIGALVGGEGLIAVLVPVWVGRFSDLTETRFGRRIPFLVATAPVAALALCLLPFAPSLAAMAVEVFVFYLAYFTYFAPYRALYPDLLSEGASGRAQGVQGVFSEVGLGCALVGGGILLELWRPLPYILAAGILLVTTAVLVLGLSGHATPIAAAEPDRRSPVAEVWSLLRGHADLRYFVIGNALLTLGLGGLKSFVVLWLTEGLGKSMKFTVSALAVVAVGAVFGALLSGKLADRFGIVRILSTALIIFGIGLALGTFSTSTFLLGASLPIIALCGGAAVALPFALLMRLMPSRSHGVVAGLYDVSSGIGTVLGPPMTGAAIDLLHPFFPSTRGYGAMWPVLSASILASAGVLYVAGSSAGRKAIA